MSTCQHISQVWTHTCADLKIANQLVASKASDDPTPINANVLFIHSGDGQGGAEAGTRGATSSLRLTLTPNTTGDNVIAAILADSFSFKVPCNTVSVFWVVANKFAGESNVLAKNSLLGTPLDYL